MFCSHLTSLVPQINKVAREHFIDNLRSRADGETVVDMLKEFSRATLDVISVVSAYDDNIVYMIEILVLLSNALTQGSNVLHMINCARNRAPCARVTTA